MIAPKDTTVPDRRYAILIATSQYTDIGLPNLRCPVQDVTGFATVLGDVSIGRFDTVLRLENQSHDTLLEQTQQVLQQAGRDDLLLFIFLGMA